MLTSLAMFFYANMPCINFGKVFTKFVTWDTHIAQGCASQTPREARSRVGTHSGKLWPYTTNWAKSRGWALFCEWALFHETMVLHVHMCVVRLSSSFASVSHEKLRKYIFYGSYILQLQYWILALVYQKWQRLFCSVQLTHALDDLNNLSTSLVPRLLVKNKHVFCFVFLFWRVA